VILFATSDKGGTGRSVTSSNIMFRLALRGLDVAYVDFDFGSPTSGAIFGVDPLSRGTESGRGLHAYVQGEVAEPEQWNLWTTSDRQSLRNRPARAGRMIHYPGDAGGGEFVNADPGMTDRCRQLFLRLEEEFALSVIDLSAGRSLATRIALTVTADSDPASPPSRWLVFHRWTRQHVTAAHGLVYGGNGILDTGVKLGHDREKLLDRLRFVRTAVIDPTAPDLSGLRTPQLSWLTERNDDLQKLAAELDLGRTMRLGSVPLDPILQWHEQLLTDSDLYARQVANAATVEAFEDLATRVLDADAWERL
jgi:hypothetical protein